VPSLVSPPAYEVDSDASPDCEIEQDECEAVVGSVERIQAAACPAVVQALAYAVQNSGACVRHYRRLAE
jgi:hypothetical protein